MAEGRGLETDRAALLARYDLDTGGFATLDQITAFAAALCATPIALVSIVEDDRQRFLARTGLDAEETPRDMSFCAHAMQGSGIFVVPDTAQNPNFRDNPLVTGAPFIRFYAGAPLIDGEGASLGALCVIDDRPREGLTDVQRQGISLLARQVMVELEGRRRDRDVIARQQRDAQAVAESDRMFRTLADTMPQMVWSTLPDGYHDYYNARWYEFTGVPLGSTDGEGWNGMFHPEDQERAWERWRHSLKTGEPYEIEYRLRHHSGDYRWTLGRALPIRDEEGAIARWIGTCTDINDQIAMVEEREVIAHELSHRIKNIFSVISGLIGLSARQHPEIRAAADDLRDRIMALGRAHDFVRPHGPNSQPDQDEGRLWGILEQIFAPYRDALGPRIRFSGDNPAIDDRSATPLALLFHELATNAAKYGALSVPSGGVAILVGREGEDIRIDWREEGGPPALPATHEGFGSRLMQLSIERQLGGRMTRDWRPEGLGLSLWIPARSMSRMPAGKG
ncbi:histidine kinase [Sphingobium sp. 22B]|uniref:sensor histidine kinase n=1 Tax=unclassified Sphingobium TaxID=2611147 RepID=UPI0007834CAA|nr:MULTISPECIES: PAS domain-containing protein [unclassified Sphingobium]KXU31994.1 histidine kinase [Sphingobium sp. AM]KYC31973.1 histidine kinase [Sphingobium sp. 22B]OAP31781.1 histidine kinase [Sphingobium sp. 20006FA]